MVSATSPQAGDHAGATDEAHWQAWSGWDALPEVELPPRRARVVVLAAHPDDEVLAVGGLLARLADRGCDLLLVAATDGEASHLGRTEGTNEGTADSGGTVEFGDRRARELDAARTELGLGHAERVRLHLPDTDLPTYEGELTGRLESLLGGAALVLAPWRADAHPDHDAAGRAAAEAVRELAAVTTAVGGATAPPVLWEYPVWAWHWSRPDADDLPWSRARVLRLDPHERLAKQQAIGCFTSQLEPRPAEPPVLPPAVLAHFERSVEVVFT